MVIAEQKARVPLTGLLPMPVEEETAGETDESEESEESESSSTTDNEESDSGPMQDDDDDGDGGSCDCRADQKGPAVPALLGLFGLMWWRRRR